jgi:formiminoglutamase
VQEVSLQTGWGSTAGFASGAGVWRNHGRPGAEGPSALRRALSSLAWHAVPTIASSTGDIVCEATRSAQQDTRPWSRACCATIACLSVSAALRMPGPRLGVRRSWRYAPRRARHVTDAHLDLRRPEVLGRGTSGTPFLQIAEARVAAAQPFRYLCIGVSEAANTPAILQRGAALGVEMVLDVDVGSPAVETRLQQFIAGSSAIYLTFCLDVLPPAVAPGVSAPPGLGVALHRAVALLREVLRCCGPRNRGGKLLLADIAEFNPRHDPDGRTARTAARIVYEMAAISR